MAARYQQLLDEDLGRAMLGGSIVESGSIVVDGPEGQLARMRRRLASG
jgi:hypothetical protein